MKTPTRPSTLYQSAKPVAPTGVLLKFSCYHCLEPVCTLHLPDEPVPDLCPVCSRRVHFGMAMQGLPAFSELQHCWRIVQQAIGRAGCEDALTRSYKSLEPSDYDDAKQDFFDFSDAAEALETRLRQEPYFYDDIDPADRLAAAEARVRSYLPSIPKSEKLGAYLDESSDFRRETLAASLRPLSPLDLVTLQIKHLEPEVWGWWFTWQGKKEVMLELSERKARYEMLLKVRP